MSRITAYVLGRAMTEFPEMKAEPVTDQTTTIARWLAVGQAHVTVTKTARRINYGGGEDETQIWFVATCEACGQIDGLKYTYDYRTIGYRRLDDDEAEKRAQQSAETTATTHAKTCRRIPERLWPKDGA